MRHISTNRRNRLEAARPWRESFAETLGYKCEWCGKPTRCVHEIPRAGVRSHVCDNPACVLLLCDPGCHQTVGNWPKAKQLALLYLRRPGDYSLQQYNRWAVARLTQPDVDARIEELTTC